MFKEYNQKQNFLIPPSYDEFLGEKHEAKLLNNIINWLELKYLYESYNNKKLWTTAYNPIMLLKILFYWYINSCFSSRKIANKLKSDLWFMYLAWNNKPDFRTINNFRKNKWELLEKVFVEIVYLASELWLVKFWTFSIDGTQIYANASKHKNIDLERLKEKIWWLFKEADNIDDLEYEIYWDKDTLIPTLSKIKEKFKKLPKQILADKWYWTEENYNYLENEEVESYIPHQEYGKTDTINFKYDKDSDTYEDLEWNIYKFKQFVWSLNWKTRWRPKKLEIRKEENYQAKLYMAKLETWENKFLQISKKLKKVYQRNDERLYSEKWKKVYSKRSSEVETVFWNTNHNLWFSRFLLRWLKWVQIEWNLINLAHNLKKIMKFQTS